MQLEILRAGGGQALSQCAATSIKVSTTSSAKGCSACPETDLPASSGAGGARWSGRSPAAAATTRSWSTHHLSVNRRSLANVVEAANELVAHNYEAGTGSPRGRPGAVAGVSVKRKYGRSLQGIVQLCCATLQDEALHNCTEDLRSSWRSVLSS